MKYSMAWLSMLLLVGLFIGCSDESDDQAIDQVEFRAHYCMWAGHPETKFACNGGTCKVVTINGGGQCLQCYGGEDHGANSCGPDERRPQGEGSGGEQDPY